MYPIVRSLALATLGLCLTWGTVAEAGKNKVQHANVVDPAWSGAAVDVGVGQLTGLVQHGGVLYVAGQSGIAAVDASGAITWKLDLPPAMLRLITVDDKGVAFTAYSVKGVDPAEGFSRWAWGKMGDVPEISDVTVGMLNADGTLAWSVANAEQVAVSPPGLADGAIGVMGQGTFAVYNRADGALKGSATIPMFGEKLPGVKGMLAQATRGQPAVIGDAFFATYFGVLLKVDMNGALIEKEAGAGLTAYVDITCGPVKLGDTVIFGTTGDTNVTNLFVAMKDTMKNKWKEASPDASSGCGALVLDGTRVIAASNFYVFAMDEKGKTLWTSVNKKGGLYPSSYRGIRYLNSWFGIRKSYGDLVVTNTTNVFVGADNGGDVITVLDGATGAYVKTIAVMEPMVAMAIVGDKVAVATEKQLKFLPAN